jgi:hypothetical protein
MALFGFDLNPSTDGRPDWLKKLTSVFGYMDYEEQTKDVGYGLADKDRMLAASGENGDIIGAQMYGNMRRYINHDEPTKPQKLRLYRMMADYPEIKYALSMICDEMINHSDLDGNVGKMEILNTKILENVNKTDNLRNAWKHVFDNLLDFKNTGHDAILSFLVSGELMYEKIINPERKSEGLKRIKRLRPDNVYPVWSDDRDEIMSYKIKDMYDGGGTLGEIPKNQLSYCSWDQYSENAETGEIYVLSYLEPVKKVWRQLQLLEEAVIIYRIVRAPERRVFKIATGNMPKAQAEAYVQKLMRTYRQKKLYNTSTGEIDGQNNILAMLEDYWFTQPADGNTSEIDTLQGGENLGEITDLNYFLEKLYRALEIPINRRIDHPSGQQTFNQGSIGDISWQEVKFSKMVARVRRKVVACIFDIYKTHLKLTGLWDQYNLKDTDFRVELNRNNHFEELKRAQVEEVRLTNWGTVSSYVGDVFSKEMAVKHFLNWSDEEWRKNKELMDQEKLDGEGEVEEGGGGGL